MSQKEIKPFRIPSVIFFLVGLLMIMFSMTIDLFRGRPYELGWVQIPILIAGASLVICGFLDTRGKLIPLLIVCRDWLVQKISLLYYWSIRGKKLDYLFVAGILLYALFYFIGRWNGLSPALLIDKDADSGAIMSYAAALDHPDYFMTDIFISPEVNGYSVNGIYLPLTRFFAGVFNDYGLAYLILLPFCIFLQLSGFYLLGKELFKDRFWAGLLAIVSAIPVHYGFWDFWGLIYDPLPRIVFQALLPFILWLFLRWSEHPLRWPSLMAASSILFFIHVISAPALALFLWAGFFLYLPRSWKLTSKILFQFGNGLVFAVLFSVFTILSKTNGGFSTTNSGATYQEIMQYLNANMTLFLNLGSSFLLYLKVLLSYTILVPAILCVGFIYLTRTFRDYKTNLILVWLSACLLISLPLPMLEHAIEKSMNIPPVQLDLVRNLRYTIPLLLILVISGLSAIQKNIQKIRINLKIGSYLVFGIYLVGFLWGVSIQWAYLKDYKYDKNYAFETLRCIMHGHIFCPTQTQIDEAASLAYIRNSTPITSRYLSLPDDRLANEIRYAGLRSVAYTRIDKNRIVYNNLKLAAKMSEIETLWKDKLSLPSEEFYLWVKTLSCDLGATHWLMESQEGINLLKIIPSAKSIYQNGTFEIIELPQCK
jgi:hypothetical protein